MIYLDTAYQLLVAQATIIFEVTIFLLLFAGYWLAQEKKIVDHRKLMRYLFWSQTILNIIMVYSYIVIPFDVNFIPHIIFATPLYLLILYTYLVMERKLPEKIMVPRKHRPLLMRITAVAWGIAILSGIISYMIFGM